MIHIVIWNCLGFFFLDFSIPFIAMNELNASGLEMGVLFSIITIGGLLCAPIAGWLTDRTSRSKLVFFGAFGRGISYFILYTAIILNSYVGIAFGYFMLGFGVGFFWVPLDTLIAEKTDKDHRSFAYGKREAAQGQGILIGTAIGATFFLIGNAYFPEALWFIYLAIPLFGIANILAGVLFLRRVDEHIKFYPTIQPNPADETNQNTVESKKSANLLFWGILILLVTLFLNQVNGSMAKPFVQYYLLSTLTTDSNLVILVYLPAGILSLLIGPYLGRLVDRVSPYIGITVASSIGAFATFVLINVYTTWDFMLVLVLDSTMSVTSGLIIQNFISRVTKTHRGRLFGARTLFVQLGGIIGPVLGGILWDTMGIKWPFIVSIYVELALIPLFLIAMKKILPHLVEK
jgi:MFS family permease